METPERRYVHLKGRAEIGINSDGRLTVVFFNRAGDPINEDKPFEITNIPSGQGNRLKLMTTEIIASFTEEAYNHHKATIEQLDPQVGNWSTAEVPTEETAREMTPTGPPHN